MIQNEFADYLRKLGKSENTIKTYCHNMEQFFRWCRDSFDDEPQQLYRANVLDYISYMRNVRGYHAKTVNNHLSSLRSLNGVGGEPGSHVRNTVDLLNTVRYLKDIGVKVQFGKEHIHSLSGDGDMLLQKDGVLFFCR